MGRIDTVTLIDVNGAIIFRLRGEDLRLFDGKVPLELQESPRLLWDDRYIQDVMQGTDINGKPMVTLSQLQHPRPGIYHYTFTPHLPTFQSTVLKLEFRTTPVRTTMDIIMSDIILFHSGLMFGIH